MFYRLIPILLNGMKYAEIDLILLKVSNYNLSLSHVVDRSTEMQFPRLLTDTYIMYEVPMIYCRLTQRKTRMSLTKILTSGLGSTEPEPITRKEPDLMGPTVTMTETATRKI